jgi:phage protein D
MANRQTAPDIQINVDGKAIKNDLITSVTVESHLNQPDMAVVCLSNLPKGPIQGTARFSSTIRAGADLEIKMGQKEGTPLKRVFLGKSSGGNPEFDEQKAMSNETLGMNALHPLSRERKTRTFTNQTVQQIVSKILQENSLSPNFGKEPPTLLHEHLHQWNMTDLEFLRLLGSRNARNLWVDLDNKTCFFVKYEKDSSPVAKLAFGQEGKESLMNFSPRMNAGAQVKKVKCYGYDSAIKDRMVGEYTAGASPLGGEAGASSFGDAPELNICDIPVRSKEEAALIAESTAVERNMHFITGTLTTKGNADIKLGTIIEIDAEDNRFDGKYYVSGVIHQFSHGANSMEGGAGTSGFMTHVEVQRDAGMGGGG